MHIDQPEASIIGDIAMQQVEKHYMAVEVIAVQFFPIFVSPFCLYQ